MKKAYWLLMLLIPAALVVAQGTRDRVVEPQMPPLDYAVESKYGFEQTIEELKKASDAEKFGVQGLHEMSKILESKGFPREPLAVLEVCNPKHATDSLNGDIRTALMMPCPISIYQQGDKVYVSTFDTKVMAMMYKGDGMAATGAAVDKSLRKIISSVAKNPEELYAGTER